MARQPRDRGEWTENAVRLAYAELLVAVFKSLRHENMTAALEAGSRIAPFLCCLACSGARVDALHPERSKSDKLILLT